jgi:phosphoglycerol geranylgeranyltransferase
MKWKDWVHVTKLDPDKQLKPGDIDAIAASGTDALMLSGTLNVTQENLSMLQKQLKNYDLPLVMEPAGPEAVLMQGIDYVFVPSVMNTTDVAWLVGKHRAWIQQQKGRLPWDVIVPEAYIVLNPNSSVGKVTKSVCDLNADEVAAYVTVADRYFHFPIVHRVQRYIWQPVTCKSRFGGNRPFNPLLRRRYQLRGKGCRDEQICRHDRGRERGLRPGSRGPESDR